MMENALSILSVIFSVQPQQTEISERKLFIFHLGCKSFCSICVRQCVPVIPSFIPRRIHVSLAKHNIVESAIS